MTYISRSLTNTRSSRTLLALFGLLCVALILAPSRNGYAIEKPNFVVIVTDDQSWVGTSLQIDPADSNSRSDYYQTPNIERFSESGMRFTQAYSPAPYCCPTRRSLLIGQTPARHIYQKDQGGWTTRYRKQLSLPQMLKKADPSYRTAHFGKWDMRFDNLKPETMGYDVSDGYTNNSTGGGYGSGGPAEKEDPKQVFGITQRACDFIENESRTGKPFFVQVSHYAVHLDIFYRKQSLTQAQNIKPGVKHTLPEFAAMTSDVDVGIGILLDKIKSLGLDNSTYVFFMSDNGGRKTMTGQQKQKLPRNHPLRDGKGTVYEGGIRVPFIVRGPNVPAGSISRVAITGLDIFPTIAELAGYPSELPKTIDGGSLMPILSGGGKGEVVRNKPFLIFHQAVARSAATALIKGDHKLVKSWSKNRLELFDLSKDIGETKDLSKTQPDKAQELHDLMNAFLEEVDAETRKTGSKKDAYKNAKPVQNSEPKASSKK